MKCPSDLINSGENEIYVLLSSPGGSVASGVALYNYITSLPARVIIPNIGIVDSVANLVFLAGTKRYAAPNSSFLFHGVGFDIRQATRFEMKECARACELEVFAICR